MSVYVAVHVQVTTYHRNNHLGYHELRISDAPAFVSRVQLQNLPRNGVTRVSKSAGIVVQHRGLTMVFHSPLRS